MKKLSLVALAVFGLLLFVPAPAAKALDAKTYVTGTVTENGSPVSGANITAVCNGHEQYDTTDGSGAYLVEFNPTDCADADTVVVTATASGGRSGVEDGEVEGLSALLNIAVVNVTIPEFGTIAGVAALLAGAGVLFLARRGQ
jgi:hypothetical protein